MTRKIEVIRALEILDSRGNPTLRVPAGCYTYRGWPERMYAMDERRRDMIV